MGSGRNEGLPGDAPLVSKRDSHRPRAARQARAAGRDAAAGSQNAIGAWVR